MRDPRKCWAAFFMKQNRNAARRWSRQSTFRLFFFALPVLLLVAAYGVMLFSPSLEEYWSSERDGKVNPSFSHEGNPRTTRRQSPYDEARDTKAEHPAAVVVLPHEHKPVVSAQRITLPLQALPQWHRFPPLPDGVKAKGPVGAKLLLTVAADGSVIDASVQQSTGADWLDQQAIDWVKAHWRYKPAHAGLKPVAAATTAIVLFEKEKLR